MMINMRELSAEGKAVQLHDQLNISEFAEELPDVAAVKPLQVRLTAQHVSGLVEVTGSMKTEVEFVCSKCLRHFEEELAISFHESFSLDVQGRKEDEDDDDDDEEEQIHFVTGNKVDLDPYIKENVLLELPYAPVCDEACKGLCPVCGTNRNETDCGCVQDKTDPRLAGLKDFFKTEIE